MVQDRINLIGYASGIAGADIQCGTGPIVLQNLPELASLHWETMIHPTNASSLRMDQKVGQINETLAMQVSQLVSKDQRFCVLGGDHSCAIGTWSGAASALQQKGDIGLIWVDAHMDSHTPETSLSGRIHGMPLASLLGYGYPTLTSILSAIPKLKPQNICLIGTRSYEAGEAALLKSLNVRIYFMEEVKQRGLLTVWREAVEFVNQHTVGYGISLDLDSIDPTEAPGVDVPEPDGLHANDVSDVLAMSATDPRLIGTEIVEFDPSRDKNNMTEKLVLSLLDCLMKGKQSIRGSV